MSVTRRSFISRTSAAIAASASSLATLAGARTAHGETATRAGIETLASAPPSQSSGPIQGFEPDLGEFMTVRHEWALKLYRMADVYLREQEERDRSFQTAADVAAWGQEVRQQQEKTLGGLLPRRRKVDYKVVREMDVGGVRAEVIRFESLPDFVVPGTIYHRAQPGVGPAILIVAGHVTPCKEYPDYQRLSQELARNGFTVLSFDWMGLGERFAWLRPDGTLIRAGSHEHNYMGLPCHLAGFNLGRYILHDATCALTLLANLPNVDAGRVGVTGHSGGGLMTSYMALYDERVQAAASVCYICDRHRRLVTALGSDAESTLQGALAAGVNSVDAFASFVPKPTLIAGVNSDIFPTEAVLSEAKRLKNMYKAAGAPENTEHFLTPGKHSYNEAIRHVAVRFFAKHLGSAKELDLRPDAEVPVLDRKTFWVSKTGYLYRDEPELAKPNEINARFFTKLPQKKLPREKLPERLGSLARIDAAASRREPPHAKYIRRYPQGDGELRYFCILSEYNLNLGGIGLFPSAEGERASGQAWLVLTEKGANEVTSRSAWARERFGQGDLVIFADVRGRGGVEAAPINANPRHERYGTEAWFNSTSVLLGTSEAAQRTHDVVRWYSYLEHLGYTAATVRVVTDGATGLSALFGSTLAGPPRAFEWTHPLPDWDELARGKGYDYSQWRQSLGIFGIARHFTMGDLLEYVGAIV